ncbi:hypothetical protein PRZ48_008678 [Zasmidium cellare]|uniref:Uncharacterized protein n=1 Tax=Zasmidium cellare TaxID=395010 RepID=A0ABR0EGJ3_ZASCE|nr:hypothetical protein PRZ48_008678 [Zasmidium cellare]
MAQARIFATLSTRALKEQIYGHRIVEYQNYLWYQGHAVCLGLARVPGRPRDPATGSFLDIISSLAGFEPGSGHTWVVTERHEGSSWRPKQAVEKKAPPGPASPMGGQDLGDGAWGYYRPERQTDFLLMVHPWGSNALVLAQIVNAGKTGDQKGQRIERGSQCALCFRSLTAHAADDEPCLFHPGAKDLIDSDSSASEASDDEMVDSYPDSSAGSSEIDDDAHDEVLVYRCCGRRGDAAGCTAETRHMPIQSGRVREWRRSWIRCT